MVMVKIQQPLVIVCTGSVGRSSTGPDVGDVEVKYCYEAPPFTQPCERVYLVPRERSGGSRPRSERASLRANADINRLGIAS